jgi:putative peptide zinc metalloprotease protein
VSNRRGQNDFVGAASERALQLRVRPDLVIRGQLSAGSRSFIVKDPLKLSYSHLTEQEHFILSQLDGETSLAKIEERFSERFAPQRVSASQVHAFLATLHRSGLLLGETAGQGEQLEAKRKRSQGFDLLRWAEKVLAIRWRGINPEPLLNWLEPKFGWLFSRGGFFLWSIVVFWGALAGILNFDEFAHRWPESKAWLAGPNLLWLGLAMIGVKTLHELGHALAARRMGSRCNEIGVQLFFLLPCLYTNVSDVWLLPNKWRRVAVSAAGIYVELLLAALATLVWWRAEPGVLSSLCQSIILITSVGTLVLNGNPLMRYDGYYILADLLEIPNLEQRSRSQLVALLARLGAGIEWQPPGELTPGPRPWLAAYAAAAVAYRAAVLIAVYLATRAMLRQWRLEPVSDVLVAGAVLGITIPLAQTMGQFLVYARRTNELRPARLAISAVALVVIVAGALLLPWPRRVIAPVVIEARDASRIYATVAGTLRSGARVGSTVQQGQIVAELENADLRRDLVRLETEHRQQELRLLELETIRGDDPASAAAIPTARQSLADLDARLGQVRELIEKLMLHAPHDGLVLPSPKRRTARRPNELTSWVDTPLNEANRGAFIETGTLLCLIGRPGDIEAVAIVDQADAALIPLGNAASVAMPQKVGGPIAGTVVELGRTDADELPLHLTATGAVLQQTDETGGMHALQTTYQIRIRLDNAQDVLPGATGRALIVGTPETLATRVKRWFGQTFRM